MPSSARRYRMKRLLDLLLCLLGTPLVVPLLLFVALAVRIESPGPVLFTQARTGRDGRRFRMFKFRTMVANAEELKASLAHLNVLEPPDFKIPNDPRITRVGRFLRAASLDELPQILNVVRGEMSLVGPRPTSFDSSTYAVWHGSRLDVRPGITGLWQVRGRHTTSFDDRLRLDIQYIRRMSLLVDLKILSLTFGAVLRRSGA